VFLSGPIDAASYTTDDHSVSPLRRVTAQLTPIHPVSPMAGLTLKAALFLGFGLTLGLWFFAGWQLTRRMADVEAKSAAINERYMRAQSLLSNMQTQALRASVFLRDALLDPDPSTLNTYRQRFDETCQSAADALARYVPVLDTPDERARVLGLRREIDDFHRAMLDVFATDSRQWPRNARLLLQQQVVPKRELVMRVSDQVQTMNREAFVQQRSETSNLYRAAQRRAAQYLGLALAASLGIGLLATLYASRLEARVNLQRVRDLTLTDDLHRLSARLATVQEDERRRIARELHDEVGQTLTATKVELALAQRAVHDPASAIVHLEEARTMTESTMRTIRDLSHLLHPSLLDDLGLAAALKSLLESFGRRHGIQTELTHEQVDSRLATELETALYRIVQEALTNVSTHAHATTCRVSLRGLATTVCVTIEDDGTGFDPAKLQPLGRGRGLGLVGIRERVVQHAGTLQLESAPGQGTRLTIEMPARIRPQVEPVAFAQPVEA
jgi:signal transduction histidine kinase